MSYIEELKDMIRRLHGCESSYIESVSVKESFQGKTIWEGDVEVFDLYGHPKATRIYVWAHETEDTNKPKRYVTVLHVPPVTSPQLAVKAAIIQEYRNREQDQES